METKMTVYNVIILDKSGSMSSIARQAVDGVNETIGSIRSAQEKKSRPETHGDIGRLLRLRVEDHL